MQRSMPSNHTRRWGTALIATIAAGAMLVGCSGSPTTSPTSSPTPSSAPTNGGADWQADFDALVAAAQAEGSLLVYGSPGEPGLRAAVEAFQEKYGIRTEYIRIVGGELSARYQSEKQAGARTADAIVINLASFVPNAIADGIATPLEELDIPGYPWDFPEEFLRPQYGTAVVGLQVRGITYNTDFVNTGEITDWPDLLDPKWTGRIGVPDPVSAAVYIGHWYTIGETQGGAENFLTSIQAQLAPNAIYASGVPASAAAGAGEVWIIPVNIASVTKTVVDQGAPLEFIIPPVTTTDEQVLVINNAPANPNAAKLFAQFMMTAEGGQAMAVNNNELSPFDSDKLPDSLLPWPIELADQQRDNVNRWLTGR